MMMMMMTAVEYFQSEIISNINIRDSKEERPWGETRLDLLPLTDFYYISRNGLFTSLYSTFIKIIINGHNGQLFQHNREFVIIKKFHARQQRDKDNAPPFTNCRGENDKRRRNLYCYRQAAGSRH